VIKKCVEKRNRRHKSGVHHELSAEKGSNQYDVLRWQLTYPKFDFT
jgi:hypothetical protein